MCVGGVAGACEYVYNEPSLSNFSFPNSTFTEKKMYIYSLFHKLYYASDNWEKCALPFKKLDFGKWEITVPPNPDGSCPIPHLSRVKVRKAGSPQS